MNYKPVLTRRTRDGLPVEVVDLVPLHGSEPETFGRLFRQGQRIYHNSFPPEEKEPTEAIRGYIASAAAEQRKGTKGRGTFSYIVPIIDGKAEGMFSYSLLPCDGFSEVFADCAAVSKRYQGRGVGSILADAAARNGRGQSEEMEVGRLKYMAGVVEQPATDYSDMMRDCTRPRFHQTGTGMGAATFIDKKTGEMTPAPFAQPGIIETHGVAPMPVPIVVGITPIEKGALRKIKAQPETVVSPSGKIMRGISECTVLGAGEFSKITDGMFYDYRDAAEGIYDPHQIDDIHERLYRSLERADSGSIFIVPLNDTRHLKRSEYRRDL